MISYMLRGVIAAAVIAAGVAQAYAAKVKPEGQVAVNGEAIAGPVEVSPGSTVSVSSGSARIYYANGCTQLVKAYRSEVVQSDPVCDTGFYLDDGKKAMLIAGGFALGGVIYWIASDDDDDKKKPHSP